MEIPGKAACVAPVDSIEGPTVQLGNGDILRVDSINDALKVMGNVSEILDLGEILISYGDFLENRQPLVPEGTRVGARMGRPEKSAPRKMKPSPHVLFPLGDISNRSILEASEKGEMEVEIGVRTCQRCGKETLDFVHCSLPTRYKRVERRRIDVGSIYHRALKTLGEDIVGVKGVKGLISRTKTPESIAKGILRKKHDVFVFKDGTIRYDMTNLPLTHFYPKEINVGVEKLRELGYESDAYGEPLRNGDQLVELNVQDVIVSEDAGEYLLRAACFIDDLLCKYYGLQPSYNVSCKEDLIGSLVIGLAPHTSAGIIGRILGFIPSSVCYAHPFFHAAKRRNADGDEDCLILLLDALINFSRYYLPEGSGGRMDTPLMISTRIDINEVDSEARNMDAMQEYPHDFYESLGEGKSEDLEEKMELISGLKDFWFTHSTSDIAAGPRNSAYTSGTMPEKVDAQLDLARRIHAVDEDDVAERIISCHFIPDLVGNLRAFSKQQFRCTRCNTKYRRPTLSGKCKCGAKLVLTVHEGSVKKYLELSKKIADSYHIKDYTRQRLNLIEDEMNSIFEPKIQMDLSEFV
jgi:DNA polymerase II large subunit